MAYYTLGIPGIRNLSYLPQNVLQPSGSVGGMGFGGVGGGAFMPFPDQQQMTAQRNLTAAGPMLASARTPGFDRNGNPVTRWFPELNPNGTWKPFGPATGTMPPQTPPTFWPGPPGGTNPPGSGSGSPPVINSLPQATPNTWMPAPLAGQYGTPQQQREMARQQRHDERVAARANMLPRSQRIATPGLTWNYSGTTMPPGAGTGGYYPGTGGEAMARMQQDALANFDQWAQGKGFNPRQLAAMRSQIGGNSGSFSAGAGGMGAGFSGGNSLASNLISQYQKAMDAANRANEQRYNNILGGYYDLYRRQMADMEGLGQREAADIQRSYQNRAAGLGQDMVSRGLTNTTVRDSMLAGNTRLQNEDLGRLNERLRRERLGTEQGLMGNLLSFMERKDEIQPDYNQLIQLAMKLGQAGPVGGSGFASDSMGGGGPIFMNAGDLGFGNPLAGMMMPGGGLGGTIIRSVPNMRFPSGRRRSVGGTSGFGVSPFRRTGFGDYNRRYPRALPAMTSPPSLPTYA